MKKKLKTSDNTFLKFQGTRRNNSQQVVAIRNIKKFLIDIEDEKEVEEF